MRTTPIVSGACSSWACGWVVLASTTQQQLLVVGMLVVGMLAREAFTASGSDSSAPPFTAAPCSNRVLTCSHHTHQYSLTCPCRLSFSLHVLAIGAADVSVCRAARGGAHHSHVALPSRDADGVQAQAPCHLQYVQAHAMLPQRGRLSDAATSRNAFGCWHLDVCACLDKCHSHLDIAFGCAQAESI